MAKRKHRKTTSKPNFKFSIEITGLILILIGIIGVGTFGQVGTLIKQFGMFLMGSYWVIVVLLLIVLGMYMLFKGKMPNFLSRRMFGLYLLLVAVLSFAHITHLVSGNSLSQAAKNSVDTFLAVIDKNYTGSISPTGGGIIGLFFSWCFVSLLDKIGTYIILGVIGLASIFLLFNLSLVKIITNMRERAAARPPKEKREKVKKEVIEEDDEEEEEDDGKIIVHSVEELKKIHSQEEAPVEAPTPVETVPFITTNSHYRLPNLNQVLNPLKKNKKVNSDDFIKSTSQALEGVLADFQITGKVVDYHEGPTVTQFEVAIKNGTKVSKITGISKEIALALAAKDVRIEAPIPGKTTVGIEIPNREAVGVPIREVLESKLKEMAGMKLPVSLGKDINGNLRITDLAKTPHLLVAGSTGSGKSVCVNSFINSLLITKRPDEVKLVLVDPKKVELSNYNGIPHLLCPVVTDPAKANTVLKNIVKEMEDRYNKFADERVKNISGYNDKMAELKKQNPDDETIKPMTYILVIIDELADLMLVAAKEVEDSIMRITQMARAAGIHLIVATQRPSTDVITGVVKANIPSRISFAVASQIDSRTILDAGGAEKLLGKGDMLFKPMGENTGVRIQGNFISDEEIEKVIDYVSKEQVAQYDDSLMMSQSTETESISTTSVGGHDTSEDDPLYNEIVEFAVESGKISASLIQRRFRLGYNRAARIIDLLEDRGIIGPPNGSKPREVLIRLDKDEMDTQE